MSVRGLLGPGSRFELRLHPPSAALAPYVVNLWTVTWDLRDRPPHEQRMLPEPSVNVTVLPAEDRVVGVHRAMFTQWLTGVGRVTGARFRPGAFRDFLGAPVSTITDRILPIGDVFDPSAAETVAAVRAAASRDDAAAHLDAYLAARVPEHPHPRWRTAVDAVARIAADPALTNVRDLAADVGYQLRALQRLFSGYVGVNPKWVIRRYRMREAADRAATGAPVDWAVLAGELGYSDQSHFVRDFTRTIGMSPVRYSRLAGDPDW